MPDAFCSCCSRANSPLAMPLISAMISWQLAQPPTRPIPRHFPSAFLSKTLCRINESRVTCCEVGCFHSISWKKRRKSGTSWRTTLFPTWIEQFNQLNSKMCAENDDPNSTVKDVCGRVPKPRLLPFAPNPAWSWHDDGPSWLDFPSPWYRACCSSLHQSASWTRFQNVPKRFRTAPQGLKAPSILPICKANHPWPARQSWYLEQPCHLPNCASRWNPSFTNPTETVLRLPNSKCPKIALFRKGSPRVFSCVQKFRSWTVQNLCPGRQLVGGLGVIQDLAAVRMAMENGKKWRKKKRGNMM